MLKIKDGFQGERAIILPAPLIKEMETDPFCRQLHVTDIGYYPHAGNHFRERKEGISQYILIYCIRGKGWCEYNGQRHQIFANDFFIIPAYTPHKYGADKQDPWTIYWIHFKGETAHLFAASLDIPAKLSPDNNSRIAERLGTFEEIFKTLQMGYGKENLYFAFSCLYYFLGSLTYIHKFRENSVNPPVQQDMVERAIHFMQENLEKRITPQEIAQFLGYSYSHFSAVFSKQTGYSPFNYYLRLKIQQACHYLDFTDMKINQVCYKVGIEDPYYFSRLFKSFTGLSPKIYRRQLKG